MYKLKIKREQGQLCLLGGKKSLTKGIRVDFTEENVNIDISVVVKYGFKIHEVCQNIQKKVKATIENMTGLTVSTINVAVQSISFEKPEKTPSVSVTEKPEA